MTDNLTILKLLMFNTSPLTDDEKNIFNFDKLIIDKFISDLNKGIFYLGGQLIMKPNDPINLSSIQQVREINIKRNIEYGGPCNSFEAASIYLAKKDLDFIENMIIKYNEIMAIRENNIKLK